MIVVLTGGTGGAKLIEGLAAEVDPAELTIVCNTGDDCVLHGLYISPDIDTIIYTLAGLIDDAKGWGIKGDTFTTLEQLGSWAPTPGSSWGIRTSRRISGGPGYFPKESGFPR
jgi:LPPG:FO 2-phospho-L-lactate transferase